MIKYKEIEIPLPDDYEGAQRAVLLCAVPDGKAHGAVLYIHGYIDYFFQHHMAEHFLRAGMAFCALDLRKYGRSLLPGQHPYYVRRMEEYFPEIDRSLEIISAWGVPVTMIGHSTGGLIASLYCAEGSRRGDVGKLVLNSPFLEFNAGWTERNILIPFSGMISLVLPYANSRNRLSEHYFSSIYAGERGEWDFSTRLKPKSGVPLYFAWLRAVRMGQKKVKRGLDLSMPVLVMHSARSWNGKKWSDEAMSADAVLNIRHIKKYGARLGRHVEMVGIDGGMHDLVLSGKEVREKVLDIMTGWIEG